MIIPGVTKAGFSVFNCFEIDNEGYFLVDDLEIECWNESHIANSFGLGIAMIVLWIIGLPVLLLFYMIKYISRSLNSVNNKIRFGFLYNGFRKSKFYWEFFILFRKIIIIGIEISLNT